MKKKILLGSIASLFAVATVFNMGLLNFNKQSDATLEAITVMIKANKENTSPGWTNDSKTTVCNIPSGICDVGAQDPGEAGYN